MVFYSEKYNYHDRLQGHLDHCCLRAGAGRCSLPSRKETPANREHSEITGDFTMQWKEVRQKPGKKAGLLRRIEDAAELAAPPAHPAGERNKKRHSMRPFVLRRRYGAEKSENEGRAGLALQMALGRHALLGQRGQIVFLGQVAVPGADGRSLGNRPLLRSLAAGADHAPDFLPTARRQHGFQMGIGAPAGEAGTDSMRIKLFHAGTIAVLPRLHKGAFPPRDAAC